MPTRPKRICPTCKQAVSGPCPTCGKRGSDRYRGSSTQRGYDYQWQQFREWYLREHPLCVDCEQAGRVKPAWHVHHVAKLSDAPQRKYDQENLMALCEQCHNARTARGE